MKKLGEAPCQFVSHSTCEHRGRVFSFTQDSRKLVVTEAILGERIKFAETATGMNCYTEDNDAIGCCAFGERILLMAGDLGGFLAALVDVGDGPLCEESLRFTHLARTGDPSWKDYPFLCQVSETRALLYFCDRLDMWYCDLSSRSVRLRRQRKEMPPPFGFYTLPLRLPGGDLFVAGDSSDASDLRVLRCGRELEFEKVGSVVGTATSSASTVLLGERFVVGFGGLGGDYLDELWVFDLQTRGSSLVRRKGEWHLQSSWAPLLVRGGRLFLFGGSNTSSVYSISLAALSTLIRDHRIQRAFCRGLGIQFVPKAVSRMYTCVECPHWL